MRSIRIVTAIIFALFYLRSYSQFNTKAEYEYLKLINFQQHKALIKDNLKNSEKVAIRLINSGNEPYSAYFFNELATSYTIIGQKELAFFYLLVQRTLFPNDSLSSFHKNTFWELALSLNLDENTLTTYWNKTLSENIPENYVNRITLLLECLTELHFKELTQNIFNIGIILRSKNAEIPTWYQLWEFLTIIGVKEKYKEQIVHPAVYPDLPFFELIKDEYKKKVYRKAIKHYSKAKAKAYAQKLITEYQAQNLSFFEKFDLILKKIALM